MPLNIPLLSLGIPIIEPPRKTVYKSNYKVEPIFIPTFKGIIGNRCLPDITRIGELIYTNG